MRETDLIVVVNHRRKVQHNQPVIPVTILPDKGDDAVVCVIHVDPLEPLRRVVELMQRRLLAVETVQITHQKFYATMHLPLQQVPVDGMVMIPLAPLPELPTHKEQFLARMAEHPGIEKPEIGKLLPVITRHLGEQSSLQMNHLIM